MQAMRLTFKHVQKYVSLANDPKHPRPDALMQINLTARHIN